MDKNLVHHNVIEKLWQVYSMSIQSELGMVANRLLGSTKVLPKAQRRGAIIILGMLALAKRSVLTDHVDVLLRVGLGSWGKVRGHTC